MRQETPNILENVLAINAAAPTTTTVPLSAIVNDGGTQMRAGMDAATITEYEEAIKGVDGWPFPPVVVYHDGEKYWLADGFHRVNAAHRSGKHTAIPAEVKAGTRRDAILYAAGANASHGLRRTNGDKRRAVEVMLRDAEWSQWSDREIGRQCAVSHMFVSNLRKELSVNGLQIPAERTVQRAGQTYQQNTQNIGANRPARLFVGDLKGLVAKWMGMHWQHAWPDNPSHTNGEFWQQLTAWMHENVRETWQEGDLKEAIKALHYPSTAPAIAPAPAASRPAATPAATSYMAVWQLEGTVREVFKEVYGGQELPFAIRDMRQGAQQRTGRFWLLCAKTINADNWRHADLAQAINNVAEHFAQRRHVAPTQPGGYTGLADAARQPAPADSNLHAGAGRTPPPPLTVAELVEELTPHLASFAPGNISGASIGAQNDVTERCALVLSDFTYQRADLYRALQRISNERHLAMSKAASSPVVNGDRPLPGWVEPATVAQTMADVVAVHGEPVEDDRYAALQAWWVRLISVRSDLGDWAQLTGRHTETLVLSRELTKLLDITQSEMDAITTAAEGAQP